MRKRKKEKRNKAKILNFCAEKKKFIFFSFGEKIMSRKRRYEEFESEKKEKEDKDEEEIDEDEV
jgi:hypothetical protein